MKFCSLVSFLFAFGAPVFISAQPSCTFTLTGSVVDEHDASALDFADVLVVETGHTVRADEEGLFQLDGLCAGRYTLRAVHLGCEPVEVLSLIHI